MAHERQTDPEVYLDTNPENYVYIPDHDSTIVGRVEKIHVSELEDGGIDHDLSEDERAGEPVHEERKRPEEDESEEQ